MIKYMILVSVFLLSDVVYGECLNKNVEKYIDSYVASNKYARDNELEIIPNYFKCTKPLNRLEKYVCKDKQLLSMFQFLASARINFWERNERHEVDHKSFNDDDLKLWIKKYNTANLSNVCFDLKEQTTNYLGGGSPYLVGQIDGLEDVIFLQTNEHGISLQLNDKRIYMGMSCDVIDSLGRKGRWYKSGDKYFINIGSTVLKLNADKNIIIKSQCLKQPESTPQTKIQTPKPIKVAKQALVTTQPPSKNTEVIKVKKAELIEKSASGSISLGFLTSLFGLLAWRAS